MNDFKYGQIFKVSQKSSKRYTAQEPQGHADYYVLCPEGPDHFLLHNICFGSKLTSRFPHDRKAITLDMIENAGHYFITRGYIFEPIKNVTISYDIMPVVPPMKSEKVKLRGGIH